MTNIIATVIAVLATNWVTMSRTTPVVSPEHQFDAVVRYSTLNQKGLVVTNYYALIPWRGKTNQVLLESVWAAQQPELSRSVIDSDYPMINVNSFAAP